MSTSSHLKHRQRRGSVMGLMAILLPVLAIMAAFCINTAHVQVTRTELMVATDAAARAGGRTFSDSQSVADAKQVAINVAAMNLVNGEPLVLNPDEGSGEIEFGRTSQPYGESGRYVFERIPESSITSGSQAASAVRVFGRRDEQSASGDVPLLIPGVLNQSEFSTTLDAVAMQVDRDISLVLDRSGSMEWITYNWPSGKSPYYNSTMSAGVSAGLLTTWRGRYYYASGVNSTIYEAWVWEDHYNLGPAPRSPWEDLVSAVDAFLNVLDGTIQEEQVSVSSYSTYATLDMYLDKDFQLVRNTIDDLNTGGRTAIGKGMQEGIKTLTHSKARPNANKTMVVMTDGMHNEGIDPINVATSLASSYNLTIHTVTFGNGADQARMRSVAAIGGGEHYHAESGAELVAIFEQIANNLPTILTK